MRVHRPLAPASLRAAVGAALLLAGCADFGPPVLRSAAPAPAPSSLEGDPVAAECDSIREQIRANQEQVREAPTISTSPDIVGAAQGRADQRIEDLRDRYDQLDCPSDRNVRSPPPRMAPLPPSPAAPN